MERTTSLIIYVTTALVCAALIIAFVSYNRPQATMCENAPICDFGVTSCNEAKTVLSTCLVGNDGCKQYVQTPCTCVMVDGIAQCG